MIVSLPQKKRRVSFADTIDEAVLSISPCRGSVKHVVGLKGSHNTVSEKLNIRSEQMNSFVAPPPLSYTSHQSFVDAEEGVEHQSAIGVRASHSLSTSSSTSCTSSSSLSSSTIPFSYFYSSLLSSSSTISLHSSSSSSSSSSSTAAAAAAAAAAIAMDTTEMPHSDDDEDYQEEDDSPIWNVSRGRATEIAAANADDDTDMLDSDEGISFGGGGEAHAFSGEVQCSAGKRKRKHENVDEEYHAIATLVA